MVPVLFGFMGFAIDLGRLYLVRGELNEAANAMALAAASKLIGTTQATSDATIAASLATLADSTSHAPPNRYDFGGLTIGDTSGFYQSTVTDPAYFSTASDATTLNASGGTADGTTAQYAQTNISADAPLIWWSILTLGQSRKTTVAARAVAGLSAPLCTACGIENFAIGVLDSNDPANFGYTVGTTYTFGYSCTGTPPGLLAGSTTRVPYLLLDRYNTSTSSEDESQQLFRIGAGGLIPSSTQTQACFTINNTEVVWATATQSACGATVASSVQDMLCGLTTRMSTNTPQACTTAVTDVATLTQAYQPDTDLTSGITDYTTYVGDTRRIITVPIVDSLSATASMTVLGFRQFLVQQTSGDDANDPTDTDGRFLALYIGNPMPLKQGRFDGSCGISSGPGKVVLFQ